MSGAVQRLLGYTPEAFYQEGFWFERIHPDDQERVSNALAALFDTGRFTCEYRFWHARDSWRWMRDEANIVRDAAGQPTELIGYWTEIEERKRAEVALHNLNQALESDLHNRTEALLCAHAVLLRADEERLRLAEVTARRSLELERAARISQIGELAAGLAHEINQPLAAIIYTLTGAAKRVSQGVLNSAQTEEALRRAISHAHRAAGIVARVREFTFCRSPQRLPLRIEAVIGEIIELSRHATDAADVRLVAEIRNGLPLIVADKVQVEQVLLNLIMNSVEAVKAAGRHQRAIVIKADLAEADMVEVCVEDCGDGIMPEARARMFEPFYTTKEHGMGLGLSICQTIVEEHGGASFAPNRQTAVACACALRCRWRKGSHANAKGHRLYH